MRRNGAERARYEEEWRRDLMYAASSGQAHEVSKGALAMATHLRLRQGGDVLLGRLGVVPAVGSWLLVGACAAAAFLFGGIFLVIGLCLAVLVVFLLSRSGVHAHWSHFVLVISLVTGALAASFIWWVMGVAIDAADALAPEPPEAAWILPAFGLFVLSGLAFLCSVVFAVVNQFRRIGH